MKKSLGVSDRLHLLNILPKEGNAVTLRVLRQFKMKLSFSEEELKNWEIVIEGANIKWNQEKAKEKDIEIGTVMLRLIEDNLKKLNDEKKLIESQLDLYDKFIEEVKEEKKEDEKA